MCGTQRLSLCQVRARLGLRVRNRARNDKGLNGCYCHPLPPFCTRENGAGGDNNGEDTQYVVLYTL